MRIAPIFFIPLLILSMTSCIYRMPNDNRFSTVPNVNNPHITREQGGFLFPGTGTGKG